MVVLFTRKDWNGISKEAFNIMKVSNPNLKDKLNKNIMMTLRRNIINNKKPKKGKLQKNRNIKINRTATIRALNQQDVCI